MVPPMNFLEKNQDLNKIGKKSYGTPYEKIQIFNKIWTFSRIFID